MADGELRRLVGVHDEATLRALILCKGSLDRETKLGLKKKRTRSK
jgi:hypothetical protein